MAIVDISDSVFLGTVNFGSARLGDVEINRCYLGHDLIWGDDKLMPMINLSVTSGSVNYNGTNTFTVTSDVAGTIRVVSNSPSYITIQSGNNSSISAGGSVTVIYKGVMATTTKKAITVTLIPTDTTKYFEATSIYEVIAINKISNPTSIIAKTNLKYTENAQALVTVQNQQGTPYYAIGTPLTSVNYSTVGSTTIPVAVNVGTYTVYYYIPSTTNYNEKGGNINATIGNGVMSGSVQITGSNTSGQTLTVNTSGIVPSGATLTYQWWYSTSSTSTSGTNISGATSSTLVLNNTTYVGKYIGVTVTASKVNYTNSMFTDITETTVDSGYDYGDGSLNTVSLGYEGVLLLNGAPVDHSNGSYYSGNFRVYGADTTSNSNTLRPLIAALKTSSISRTNVKSGTVTYTLSVDASEQDMTLWLCVFGSGMTTSAYIGSLKFNVDGAFYTLSEMVSNGFIKPLVVMASSASNGRYYWNNVFNLYTGGQTASGSYAALDLVFMLNKGHKITQFQLYANKNFNTTYDGWHASMAPTDDCRLTIE